jgi:hypothetical protein
VAVANWGELFGRWFFFLSQRFLYFSFVQFLIFSFLFLSSFTLKTSLLCNVVFPLSFIFLLSGFKNNSSFQPVLTFSPSVSASFSFCSSLQTSPIFFWFFLPLLFFSSFTPLSIFVLLSSFSLSAPPIWLLSSVSIYRKNRKRGLLPLSNHGTGVGGGRATAGQLP